MTGMTDQEAFGGWLRRQRKGLDLTREALARRASCSTSTLRRLEAGDLRPSRQMAEALATALGLPSEQHEAFVRFARGEAGAAAGFAPPIAPTAPPLPPAAGLPAPLTSFVGRKREVAAVADLLREPGVRLLTLTGPPGAGKTRLALAAAQQLAETAAFADGVCFVALAPITDAELVLTAIAQALGVKETRGGLAPALQAHLRDRQRLLILDNFEQVTGAGPLVTSLLTAAPGVKALVTSRAVLGVYGEHEFPVPPLPAPDAHHLPTRLAATYFARFGALQLFRDRARAVSPGFRLTPDNAPDVARICAWLDGLPLAIEMAAARVKWLPPDQLLRQLSDRLAVLTGGPRDLSPRQQSLAGAIDWSYDLLSQDEQRLFDRLGVLAGSFDAEAARAVLGGDPAGLALATLAQELDGLVDKSLLRRVLGPRGEARFSMLESLREYAVGHLRTAGEWDAVREAHAGHYHHLALEARPHLKMGGQQAEWLDRLESEQDNLRAALVWALHTAGRYDFGLTLVEALHLFWATRGYWTEGRRWEEAALAAGTEPSPLRAAVLNNLGNLARSQGDFGPARDYQEQALRMQEALGDEAGVCRSLESLAILAGSQGDYDQAGALLERTLALRRKIGDTQFVLSTLNNLAIVARRRGDRRRAEQLYLEEAELARANNDQRSLSHGLQGLGELRLEAGDYAMSLPRLRESLSLRQRLGNRPEMAHSLVAVGMALFHLGSGAKGLALLSAATRLEESLGQRLSPAYQAERETRLAEIRAALGEAAFERGWADGQALSLDGAVALALEAANQAVP
jgi:predicted ATPase/transcriptional regulator with XRE-family HTH domain/Tfp pilus assembly protein PilF